MPSFETTQPITVTIELPQGDVHFIASDRSDTIVAVNPSDRTTQADVEAADKTVVDYVNGALFVKAPKPRGLSYVGMGRGGSVDITVELPEGSDLRAEAGFASFRCDGRLGEVRLKSGAGHIRLDQTGTLHVQTGAGTVAVDRVEGRAEITAAGDMSLGAITSDAEIKNLNGKTWVGHVSGNLRVKSANGDIVIDTAERDVSAKTANGSIEIGEVVRGAVVLETASGGLEIGIKTGTAAWVDSSTKFGRVHNSLAAAEGPDQSNETVEVRARTAFGDIVIRRS